MSRNGRGRGPSYFTRDNSVPEPEKTASELLGIPYDPQFEQYYEKDYNKSGFTLPFSKYIGPGNSLNLGAPKTDADQLARIHDLEYAHASYKLAKGEIDLNQFKELVSQADSDFIENNTLLTPHGAHAISGITAKKLIETITGQLYPGSEPNLEDYEEPIDFDFVPLGKHAEN